MDFRNFLFVWKVETQGCAFCVCGQCYCFRGHTFGSILRKTSLLYNARIVTAVVVMTPFNGAYG